MTPKVRRLHSRKDKTTLNVKYKNRNLQNFVKIEQNDSVFEL